MSSPVAVDLIPGNEDLFHPSLIRARALDRRMRDRLADSLSHVRDSAAGIIDFNHEKTDQSLDRIRTGPVSCEVFGIYYELVLEIENENLEEARRLFQELEGIENHSGDLSISHVADVETDRRSARIRRLVDTDPRVPFQVCPPDPEVSKRCRVRIQSAFERLDRGFPEMAAEIRGLIREIFLGVESEDPDAISFDGASSFMLWGGVLLNAHRHLNEYQMIQALAHESAHNLLFGLCADGPLVLNADDELYPSPLRADPRPMDGIVHATFVTARMYQVLDRLMRAEEIPSSELDEVRERLDLDLKLFQSGLETIDRHSRLTPLGKQVIENARIFMAEAANRHLSPS